MRIRFRIRVIILMRIRIRPLRIRVIILMRIRIRPFCLMRNRIHLLIKIMLIRDHGFTLILHASIVGVYGLHGSIVSFKSSLTFGLMPVSGVAFKQKFEEHRWSNPDRQAGTEMHIHHKIKPELAESLP